MVVVFVSYLTESVSGKRQTMRNDGERDCEKELINKRWEERIKRRKYHLNRAIVLHDTEIKLFAKIKIDRKNILEI